MFRTAVRLFSTAVQNVERGGGTQERPRKILTSLLTEHGPLPTDKFWELAAKEGIRSKVRMKRILSGMRKERQVKMICKEETQTTGKGKVVKQEYLYSLKPPLQSKQPEETPTP
eukprot:TRINITY_DN16455_c0_g1_i1.p1 TRINITY_DN16455_c0_g1~~TRINITY_DN16455_c0_g1_i1.p1  ORF type:complete len:114 (-),score=29.66 TRINITY_DN16455_c0_g1_i1:405-746(-)